MVSVWVGVNQFIQGPINGTSGTLRNQERFLPPLPVPIIVGLTLSDKGDRMKHRSLLAFVMAPRRIGQPCGRAEFPPRKTDWVTQVLLECRRARCTGLPRSAATTSGNPAADLVSADLTQVVPQSTAEWLRTCGKSVHKQITPGAPRTHFADRGRGCSQIGLCSPRIRRASIWLPCATDPLGQPVA